MDLDYDLRLRLALFEHGDGLRRGEDRPNREFLAERFEAFRAA